MPSPEHFLLATVISAPFWALFFYLRHRRRSRGVRLKHDTPR
jgi:hypothetical protein